MPPVYKYWSASNIGAPMTLSTFYNTLRCASLMAPFVVRAMIKIWSVSWFFLVVVFMPTPATRASLCRSLANLAPRGDPFFRFACDRTVWTRASINQQIFSHDMTDTDQRRAPGPASALWRTGENMPCQPKGDTDEYESREQTYRRRMSCCDCDCCTQIAHFSNICIEIQFISRARARANELVHFCRLSMHNTYSTYRESIEHMA